MPRIIRPTLHSGSPCLLLFTFAVAVYVPAMQVDAQSLIVAKWTFENDIPPLFENSQSVTDLSPAIGDGTASGYHASTATDWSNLSGNGSENSFSVNNWAPNDWYQFRVRTAGLRDVVLDFDATSNYSGPRDFRIDYSVNGGVHFFSTGVTYSLLHNGPELEGPITRASWNYLHHYDNYSYHFDFSHLPILNNRAQVLFRLVSLSDIAASGGTVEPAMTSRIDNVTILASPLYSLRGHYNDDGIVDQNDYNVWASTFGATDDLRADGSVNGIIDAADYVDWRKNVSSGATSAMVPEPGGGGLLLVVVSLLSARRR